MKFLVIARQSPIAISTEELYAVVQAQVEWVKRLRESANLEAIYVFPEGGGMFIGNFDSADDLLGAVHTFPDRWRMEFEIHVLADFDKTIRDALNGLAAQL